MTVACYDKLSLCQARLIRRERELDFTVPFRENLKEKESGNRAASDDRGECRGEERRGGDGDGGGAIYISPGVSVLSLTGLTGPCHSVWTHSSVSLSALVEARQLPLRETHLHTYNVTVHITNASHQHHTSLPAGEFYQASEKNT